ncbi:MAG: hypothetical protein AAB486_02650 [Patescibacteria group bacterium]
MGAHVSEEFKIDDHGKHLALTSSDGVLRLHLSRDRVGGRVKDILDATFNRDGATKLLEAMRELKELGGYPNTDLEDWHHVPLTSKVTISVKGGSCYREPYEISYLGGDEVHFTDTKFVELIGFVERFLDEECAR